MYSEIRELLNHGTTSPGWHESYLQSYERAVELNSPGLWWVRLPLGMNHPSSFDKIPLLGLLYAKRMSIICGYVQEEGQPCPRVQCSVYITGIAERVYDFYVIWPENKTTDEDIRELGKRINLGACRCITYLAGRAGYKKVVRDTEEHAVVLNEERF